MGLALTTVIFFVPALTGVLALLENCRAGDVARQRELCPGGLGLGLLRAFANSVWTLWLTVLALPLGAVFGACRARRNPDSRRPPVILVHGLYHNPAAWFVMRHRLARAGYLDVRCYGYASFGRDFADIAAGLARFMLETAQQAPQGRVLLLGHSLGGLVIRAACADPRVVSGRQCRVAGVVTLGTPHRGSTLARVLGIGRLARGLGPGGRVVRLVQALACCPAPGLSLFTPTDGMVLPLSGALLDEDARRAGWVERAVPPVSHVGLLYSGAAAREALAFFEELAGESGASGG